MGQARRARAGSAAQPRTVSSSPTSGRRTDVGCASPIRPSPSRRKFLKRSESFSIPMPARKPETTVTALVPARVQEGSLITEDDGLLFHVGIGHHNIWVAGTTFDQHESTLCDPDMRVVSSEKRTLRWIVRDLGARDHLPQVCRDLDDALLGASSSLLTSRTPEGHRSPPKHSNRKLDHRGDDKDVSSPTSRHPTEPCSNCPYRKDAPLHHWDQREFVKLLVEDEKQLGSLYACHGHVKLNNKSRGFCAGWLLDQKKRRVPSIRLRLQLHVSAEARKLTSWSTTVVTSFFAR